MTRLLRTLVAAIVGYLVGTAPSAAIASRLAGAESLTESGTGNPGGMNAAHVLGKEWGVAVGVADVGKGVVAARLGERIAGPVWASLLALSS